MEAPKLKTLDDLFAEPEERLELIGGEIVRRPMAGFSHGVVQGNARSELSPLARPSGPDGGWWIATEISVAYSEHDCPCHDLAGWRRRRLPSPRRASSTCRRTGSARSSRLATSARTP